MYAELLAVSDAEIVRIEEGSMKVLLIVSAELELSVGRGVSDAEIVRIEDGSM